MISSSRASKVFAFCCFQDASLFLSLLHQRGTIRRAGWHNRIRSDVRGLDNWQLLGLQRSLRKRKRRRNVRPPRRRLRRRNPRARRQRAKPQPRRRWLRRSPEGLRRKRKLRRKRSQKRRSPSGLRPRGKLRRRRSQKRRSPSGLRRKRQPVRKWPRRSPQPARKLRKRHLDHKLTTSRRDRVQRSLLSKPVSVVTRTAIIRKRVAVFFCCLKGGAEDGLKGCGLEAVCLRPSLRAGG